MWQNCIRSMLPWVMYRWFLERSLLSHPSMETSHCAALMTIPYLLVDEGIVAESRHSQYRWMPHTFDHPRQYWHWHHPSGVFHDANLVWKPLILVEWDAHDHAQCWECSRWILVEWDAHDANLGWKRLILVEWDAHDANWGCSKWILVASWGAK